jgi:ketosteroid isomerase-like protein
VGNGRQDPCDVVELGRAILDAVGRRDADALVARSHPDVEWWSFFALGEGGAYRGHDATRQYMRDVEEAFEIAVVEVDDALGVGDVAVFVGRIRYRGRGSGADGADPAGWVLAFRDGKLARFRAFRDPEAAMGAVGA